MTELGTTTGERIRTYRKLRGLSLRNVADQIGVAHTTWGRWETGAVAIDNRFQIADVARVLGCSIEALTGQPPIPTSRGAARVAADVNAAMSAVIVADLRYPPDPQPQPRPWAEIAADVTAVAAAAARCDYAAAVSAVPAVMSHLHAAATGGPHQRDALRQLVLLHDTTAMTVRYLGHPTAAYMVADRAQQAAETIGDDPVMLAMAAWSRAHAAIGAGLFARAAVIATAAADELAEHMTAPAATEMRGMLLLTAGYAMHGAGDTAGADGPLTAAAELAELTGETDTFWLMFGPTNVGIWRTSICADSDTPERAAEIAATINPTVCRKPSRQASFYLDLGRALARTGAVDRAVRALLTAERIGPQRIHRDPLAAETIRGLLEQRRRSNAALSGLGERIGVM